MTQDVFYKPSQDSVRPSKPRKRVLTDTAHPICVHFTVSINLGDKGSEKQYNVSALRSIRAKKAPAAAVQRVNLSEEMVYEVLNLDVEMDGVFLALVPAC